MRWRRGSRRSARIEASPAAEVAARAALDAMQSRERRQAAVAELGRRALESNSLGEVLDAAVRLAADTLEVEASEVVEHQPGDHAFLRRASVGFRNSRGRVIPWAQGDPTQLGATLASHGPVAVANLATESRFPEPRLREHGIVSSVTVPIGASDRPFGVLGAYARVERAFSADDMAFLRSVANVLGAAWSRAEVEGQLRDRELEMRLALAVGRMGSWRWDAARNRGSWSPELEELAGLEPGEFGGTFVDFLGPIHPDDRKATADHIRRSVRRGDEITALYRIVRPDGEVRWIESRGALVEGTEWAGVSIDVTERAQVQTELAESELRLRLAMGAGRMGVWHWDRASGSVDVTPGIEPILDLPDAEVGTFSAPICEGDRERVVREMATVAEAGTEFHAEYRVVLPDGQLRWIESWGAPVPVEPGQEPRRWIGIAMDVDRRKHAEDERNRLLEQANRSQQLAEIAARAEAETVARLDTLLEHAPIGFAFFDPLCRFVRVNSPLAEITGLPVESHLGCSLAEVLPDLWDEVRDAFHQVLDSGEPVVDVELSVATRSVPAVVRHCYASFYPVEASDGTRIGLGAVVIDITGRKREEQAVRLFAGAAELFATSGDLDEILDRAVALAVPDFADACHLYVLPGAGTGRRVAVAHTVPDLEAHLAEAELRWPADVQQVLAMSKALRSVGGQLIAEVTDEMNVAMARSPEHLELLREHGARCGIAVPLNVGGRLLGMLLLAYTSASDRRYTTADVGLAEELGRRIAQAIDSARLAREAERARQRLDLLARLGELLTVELDSRARLQATANLVVPAFADLCAIHHLGPDGSLHVEHLACADPGLSARPAAVEGTRSLPRDSAAPAMEAVRRGEPVLLAEVPDGEAEELGRVSLALGGAARVHSLLVVPMGGEEGTFATLTFAYGDSGRRYALEDVQLAAEIARRAAPAVDNALRYEQERATAEALQRSLLPERLPTLPELELTARYLPGTTGARVGGDWYDAIALPGGRVLLAIGDVVGHGVRAAASMGRLRNVLQFCALDGAPPHMTLERMNAYFCALADADMATVLVAEYESRTRRLRYASAGHPPPLVVHPDGTSEFLDRVGGMPISAVAGARYEPAEVALSPGALLVLFTDGLVERRGELLDLGLERLRAVVAEGPRDLDDLCDLALARLVDERTTDDIAVLAVRVASEPRSLHLVMRARPRELARLRRSVADWLAGLDVGHEEAAEIAVAVNEAAANAIEHAYGLADAQFTVLGTAERGRVSFRVSDRGRWRPERADGDRGRGLALVHELMDEVRVSPGPHGTDVCMRRSVRRKEP